MNRRFGWISAVAAAAGLSLSAAPAVLEEPYGICAHVSRDVERPIAAQEFDSMREAGITHVRTDFDWGMVHRRQNAPWTFGHLDDLMKTAARKKMNILPILDYSVPWAFPAWKHPEAWREYVNKIVSRYAGQLRYWEVWNEQNLNSFWPDPDGKTYAAFLKCTWEEIKKIDPKLTVLYGGTSGVPYEFIEESFAAGAGAWFDVMNIHPYFSKDVPERLVPQLARLKGLMNQYKIADKPIWITEIGWPTAQGTSLVSDVLPHALEQIGLRVAETPVVIVDDNRRGFSHGINVAIRHLKSFREVKHIDLDDIARLDVRRYPVLMPTGGKDFPVEYFPEVVKYVKRGGTLLLPSGLPFYYDHSLDGNGAFVKLIQHDSRPLLTSLHIGWDAWWTRDGIPREETYQKPAPAFEGKFKVEFAPASRFLHDRNLKPGDTFLPIVEAGADGYRGAVAALYKLNSDLKGNVIVFSRRGENEYTPEERQAELLPRAYLLAFSNGVSRCFWYNFRSGEWARDDHEAHFGIVRKNLEPKPAFRAYQVLSNLCPSGSTIPVMTRRGNVYMVHWVRPDGEKVWAIWTPTLPETVSLTISGTVTEAVNHLGEKQAIPQNTLTASPVLLYLRGPERVILH